MSKPKKCSGCNNYDKIDKTCNLFFLDRLNVFNMICPCTKCFIRIICKSYCPELETTYIKYRKLASPYSRKQTWK
jgi:hypothetical protein